MHVAIVCLDKGDMVNSDIAHFFLEQRGFRMALIYYHP